MPGYLKYQYLSLSMQSISYTNIGGRLHVYCLRNNLVFTNVLFCTIIRRHVLYMYIHWYYLQLHNMHYEAQNMHTHLAKVYLVVGIWNSVKTLKVFNHGLESKYLQKSVCLFFCWQCVLHIIRQ